MPETQKERRDRELAELLSELRVAIPGAQVLFAFLLTVAFSARFDVLSRSDRDVYVVAVLLSAMSTALLIAPTAHHRLRFRKRSKEGILKIANALALLGLILLGLAIGASLYLVIKTATTESAAAWCAAFAAAVTMTVWFLLPFLARRGNLNEAEN